MVGNILLGLGAAVIGAILTSVVVWMLASNRVNGSLWRSGAIAIVGLGLSIGTIVLGLVAR